MLSSSLAGAVQRPTTVVTTPAARAAYTDVRQLLARGKLGLARRLALGIVQTTAARLPPCVTPGPAQGSTFSALFRPGEALRVITSVGGGRVSLYELRPDGVHRLWQAQKGGAAASSGALARVLEVPPGAAQCGTPLHLSGPLEAYRVSPFTGVLQVEVVTLDGQRRRGRAVNLLAPGGVRTVVAPGLPALPPLDAP